ncbi:Primary amine oxidase precursor [Sporotomaculum syntrophicum]|uniref:Primary amine oxidase n=1 Tax=Sporotomaculum syntrophicum TaxID=182264 RepID=A0A9D3AXM0_9FIRM|nr:stalk domain-containing protein [Sporotomaculum syntrophicum]KAF1083864.1 Primary amine oxidase precursor [Sporotomaculum syntrophicum]
MLKVIGKLRFCLLALVLLFTVTTPALAAQVFVNGEQLNVSTANESGATLVPLRAIFQSLGANVNWDGATQTVTAAKAQTTVKLQIGSYAALVNGQPLTLLVPGKIINGNTMVPLRFVSESLGANVNWDSSTQKISISYSEPVITNNYVAPAPDVVKSNDVLTWSDGTKYEGQTINGEANGMGKITLPNGTTFAGNFEKGELNGQGSAIFSSGEIYSGGFVNGKMEGSGTLTDPSGAKYVGKFKNGKMDGKFTIYASGVTAVGYFKQGELNGKCTLTYSNGQSVTGTYKDGKLVKVDYPVVNYPNQSYPLKDFNPTPVPLPTPYTPYTPQAVAAPEPPIQLSDSQIESIKITAKKQREFVWIEYNSDKKYLDRQLEEAYEDAMREAISRNMGQSGLVDYLKKKADERFETLYERLEIERDKSLSEIDNWENLMIQQLY